MTDNIRHHLTDGLLMAYSAGSLPEAFNLTVAAHLSMCDSCRARLGAFDSVGGALLNGGERAEMSAGSMEAALAAARQRPRPAAAPRPRGTLPAPLIDYIGGNLDAVRWRPVGMGVRQAILPTDGDATARLLHIPAGAAVPDHGHRGTELTLVLQGAFADSTSRFAKGDIEIAGEDLNHTPIAETGDDCICLAATDAPLRFRGWIPRIAQPFLKI
ncbi:transcriptional regulator [Pelagivirga sediminicola]|uniref:Transcriptional regulator n=1 Tax=Pelagivirga sediminicola TaxID=2170575 RepID=A0A2T7G6D1_9RHOB|nr:ChrR family anti-sigma-E factor [Pelagivirga sediminicola]PVA09981.1 transcriptional regulator [Pelagivirga sediminicola]